MKSFRLICFLRLSILCLSWPQSISGLRCLISKITTTTLEIKEEFNWETDLGEGQKKFFVGFWRKFLDERTKVDTFSKDIADPKFRLISTGSIIIKGLSLNLVLWVSTSVNLIISFSF